MSVVGGEVIRQGRAAVKQFEAACVAIGCHDLFGVWGDPGREEGERALEDWCLAHASRHPGHDQFRRTVMDYLTVRPE
ncbi:DUF7848 domain-containing protein [Streptomyces zagrosensis]|uniref:DUF7848 domain-containing protein n=1 Tax=Streptomyces zagrosensis TaxID=1042984 RepID=A0A7W9QEI4_9ACTN|nr:hypothetical protein [Streptomyces zagrosensis]MBB5938800.1 hypothetical protein [Streptomyces zagrosensis]